MLRTIFVTLNWNTTELLKKMVASVERTTLEPHGWIVWDNGSNEQNLEELQRWLDPRMRLIIAPRNEGCIKAHNAVLDDLAKLNESHNVILIDTDVEVLEEGWLSKLYDWLADKPQIGIVGLEHSKHEVCCPAAFQDACGNWYLHDGQTHQKEPCESESVGFGFALIRRPVLEMGIRFDSVYQFYYKQDADYCFQARQQGFEIWAYSVGNVHWGQGSLKANQWQVGEFRGESAVNSRMKRENQDYFVDKWGWVLGGRRRSIEEEAAWLEKARKVFKGEYVLTAEDKRRKE